MDPNKNTCQADVVINDDVLISMAGTAALEVEGVVGLTAPLSDIRGMLRKVSGGTSGVQVSHKEGDTALDLFICVAQNAKIIDVAEAVQKNVKKTIQDMTGRAITAVHVHIADVQIKADKADVPAKSKK